MIMFQFYTTVSFTVQKLCFNSCLLNVIELVLWTKLYTRIMYPVDCTIMTGVYSVRLYETVLGTALGCAYSLGGVQPGGLALRMRMTRIMIASICAHGMLGHQCRPLC